mmetsp:Transcript_58952/g.144217  ORF Transcript_58952/g.144217 Transcript_58952/m.144217 type:complete len:1281 (+) Transcript_58952:518-4360(+)
MSRNNNNIIPIDNIDDDSRRNKKVAKRKWNFVKGAFKNLSTGTSLFSSNGKTDRDFDVSSDHDDDDDDDDGCRGGGGGVVGSSVVACTAAATSGGGDGDNRSDGAVTSNDSNILRQAVSWKALGGNDPVDEVASASSTEPQLQQGPEPDPENPVVTLTGEEREHDQKTAVKAPSKLKKKKKKATTTKKLRSAKKAKTKKKKHQNIDQGHDDNDTTEEEEEEEEEKPSSSASKKSKSNMTTKHKHKKKKKTTAGESSKSISSKSTKKTKPLSSSSSKKSNDTKSTTKNKKKQKSGKNIGVKKVTRLAQTSNSEVLELDIDDPDILCFCKSLGLKRIIAKIPNDTSTSATKSTTTAKAPATTMIASSISSTTGKTLCCVRHPNQVITTSDLLEWEQYEVVDVCKICSSEHQALNSLVEELDPVDGSTVPPITYFRRNQIHQRKSMAVCIQQIQDLQKDKELWKKRYVLASTIDEDDEDDDDEVDFSSMIDEMYGSGGSSDFRSSIQEEVETDVGEVDWLNQLGERVLQVQQWSYDEALKDQSSSEYDKYYKMISVGVPLQAVKTTITQDGLDPDGLSEELLKPSGLFRRGSDDENDNDVGVIVDRLHKTFHRRKAMHLLTAANILAKEQKKVSQKQQQRKGGVIRTKGKKKNGKNADEDEDDDEDNKKPGSWWKLQSEVADEGFIGSSDRCMPSPSDLSDVTVQELRNELEQKDNIIQSLQERIASLEREIADWEGGGYTPVSTTAASTDSSDVDDEIPISDRLLVAHQPKPSDDSVDRVSLTEEELFDEIPIQPDDTTTKNKPLLAAALKAKEERLSKSFSHFDLSAHGKVNTADMTDDLSNSVPQHLLSMNQPKLAQSSSFDTASLDEDELFEQPKTSGKKPSLLAAGLKAKSDKGTPEHLRDVNQPTRSTSFESASLDEDDLFEARSAEDGKSTKPLLAAALKAKTEGDVPDHLKDLNQPTATRSSESRSLDSDELFDDTPIDSKLVSKPLLSAALKAKANEETPVHLRNIHQPLRTRSIDSLSLDNEEIFEEPPSTPPSTKPLLEAAQKAKLEQSERSEVIITLGSLSDESEEYEELEEVCVPEHLLSLNQPKQVLPEDGNSLDEDNLFDTQVEPPSDRPLLSAALKAREQHEKIIDNPANPTARNDSNGRITHYDDVPAHLLTAHQPTTESSYEEYSIDEDELFDEPSDQPTSPKPLLAAALKARESYPAQDVANDESGEESKGEQTGDIAINKEEGFEYEEYEISIVEADTSQETTGYNAQAVNSSDDYTEVTVED